MSNYSYGKLLRNLFISVFFLLLSACQNKSTQPIAGMGYNMIVLYAKAGQTIIPLTPIYTGGPADSYSVTPALPAGLSLDARTGVISGTPTTVTASNQYAVTASNDDGSVTVPFVIAVTASLVDPDNLLYVCSTCDFAIGQPIAPLVPFSSKGQITSYSISPALPSGLSIDPASGIISGTPDSLFARTQYTVTGSNGAGTTTTGIKLSVQSVPQPPTKVQTYFVIFDLQLGKPINPVFLYATGAQVTSYTVTPDLPEGLSINANSGLISGTPTANSPRQDYVITGSNSSGSTETTITIQVQPEQPPSNLRYPGTYFNYSVNRPVVPFWPTNDNSQITQFTVTPNLPTGLELDISNGDISGTPTTVTAATQYTITGTNNLGQTQTIVTLATQNVQPGFQNNGNLYYDGASTWTKITSTATNHQDALDYCASLPAYNGGEWELPVDSYMARFDYRQVREGNLNGQGWVFGKTFINLFDALTLATRRGFANFGYYDFMRPGIISFISLPETTNYLVSCVNTKAP